ncbi:MAG: hypothetical protein J2P50_18880, partial [Hyphomicrobiaceae bacterium]|nr:hypothetical protein [Hyphomicrobiaceae bacterium]
MRARPLTAAIALTACTLLVCGATVGLEAVGVLFPSSPAKQDAEQQALLTRLEADLDSMVTPSQPLDLPNEAPPPWQDAEATTAAAPAPQSE